MIVQTIQRNVVESHDFKSEIATIDAEEMRYVSSLLRNNYSNTVLATVRETFANAVDANAGSDRPIEINGPTRISPTYRVRDFGRGLSEQDLFGLYTKYGRSTKRNDNLSIGGFGIGRFAPLSYTDSFTVTSVHNGKQTIISVYVDEFGDTRFTKMDSSASNEPSGIEISVAVKNEDIENFTRCITSVLSFSSASYKTNVKFDPISWKIKSEKWGVNSHRNPNGDCLIVMGGISYPLNIESLSHHKIAETSIFKLFNRSYVHQNFVFFFPVGAVSLHHSREALEYNQNTKNYIASALLSLEKEIKAVVQKELDTINDSAQFFVKLSQICNGEDIGSLCYDSTVIFNAKDGSNHAIIPSLEVEESAAFNFSSRSNNVVRAYKKDYRSATPGAFKISPMNFYLNSEAAIDNYPAILINDGVRNISGRAENLLINNRKIERIYVITLDQAKNIFLVDHNANAKGNIFYASKVTPLSKDKKQQYGNVRLIWNQGHYISSFTQKSPMPDSTFYYIKLVEDPTRKNRFCVSFANSLERYSVHNIVRVCEYLGIKGFNQVYGITDCSNLPDYAVDLSAVFCEKFAAEVEKFKSFINRDTLAEIRSNSLHNCGMYRSLTSLLPKDHIISEYCNGASENEDSTLAKEYEEFSSRFSSFLPKNQNICEEKVSEIRQKALTITAKYPMIALLLKNSYFYNISDETKKLCSDYVSLIDKNS